MAQVIALDNIPQVVKTGNTTLTVAGSYQGKTARATIGGQQYSWTGTLSLNTATTGAGGLDTGALAQNTLYYVYLVQSSGVVNMVASTSGPSVGPTGFTSWKEIGRFRTFLAATQIAYPVNVALGGIYNPALQASGPTLSYTSVITGSVSPPTPATAAVITSLYRVENDTIFVHWEYITQTNTGANAGNGSYYISLPFNAIAANYGSPLGDQGTAAVGFVTLTQGPGSGTVKGTANLVDVNRVYLNVSNDTQANVTWGSGFYSLTNGSQTRACFDARIVCAELVGLFS